MISASRIFKIMKSIILICIFAASAMSQRPSFAGSSPKGIPDVAARFKTDSENNVGEANVANRLGIVSGSTERIPIDARGDVQLVNVIKTWPEQNRPFWYVNADAIERQKGIIKNNNNQSNGSQSVGSSSTLDNKNQFTNRFQETNQPNIDNVQNQSFNIVMNNQWKTYVYDPVADAWFPKKN